MRRILRLLPLCPFAHACEGRSLQAGTPEMAIAIYIHRAGLGAEVDCREQSSFLEWGSWILLEKKKKKKKKKKRRKKKLVKKSFKVRELYRIGEELESSLLMAAVALGNNNSEEHPLYISYKVPSLANPILETPHISFLGDRYNLGEQLGWGQFG
uniref:Uncharacterized protein n=1 Tax=Ananas comosus var. bracteatus TaxID=296719 RepID=A0A6V7PI81_ANACO|nr:unnamed protein product [Ananas comosus var. bracteatus]